MKRDSGTSVKDKPVVIVRKKAGKGHAPTGSTPPVSSPVPRPTALAPFPEPPVQSLPLLLVHPQLSVPLPAPLPPVQLQPPDPPPSPAAAALAEEGPTRKAQEKQARRELLETFRQRWPQAFPRDLRLVKPLARGIHKDIGACLPAQPAQRIRSVIAIFQYVLAGPTYYRALLQGGPRYDLDGNPCGEVTPEEQERAKRDLQAYYERRKQKAAAKASALRTDAPASAQG